MALTFPYLQLVTNNGDGTYTLASSSYSISNMIDESAADGTGNNDGTYTVGETLDSSYFGQATYVGHVGPDIVFFSLGDYFIASETQYASGAIVTPNTSPYTPCFLRGTEILTRRGRVAVENLTARDEVLTRNHEFRPVRWVGHRKVAPILLDISDSDRHIPVRIRAGALDHDLPLRDLVVSPDHCLYFEGVLIAAKSLVNGMTVVQDRTIRDVEYFHIALDSHDVLFAEGVAAESYDNRNNEQGFDNWLEYRALVGTPSGDPAPIFPTVWTGEVFEAVDARLCERALKLGFSTTRDADLRLVADGIACPVVTERDASMSFRVAAGAGTVQLLSRSTRPHWARKGNKDRRDLGVAVHRITASSDSETRSMTCGDAALVDGFHRAERTHCWTDGCATLPTSLLDGLSGEILVKVELVLTNLSYPVAPADAPPAAHADLALTA